jgi:nucleotide-binding universal stress UspA family protein
LTVARAQNEEDPVSVSRRVGTALQGFITRYVPAELPYRPALDAQVAVGDPAQEILRAAERRDCDLIVISTRGYGRILQRVVGSVAHDVLRHARVPVLVIPPSETEIVSLERTEPRFHFERILVPLDPLGDSPEQMRAATVLRWTCSVPLLVFFVRHSGGPDVSPSELRTRIARHKLPPDSRVCIVDAASVADGIVHLAHREGAGLIVMGLERSNKRMEPGSIAYDVLRHTTALVLAVPPGHRSGSAEPA